MHKVMIPDHIVERGRNMRGGREHVFDSLDMSKVAHVIVDLQVRSAVAAGAPVEVPFTREIFPEVNAISRAVRAAGGTNAFLRYTYDPAEKFPWNVWFGNYMNAEQTAITAAAFKPRRRRAGNWRPSSRSGQRT